MPILIHSERKSTYARIIVASCYTLLIVGGMTMIVPFLLMVSGSFKGKVDAHDYDLFPAFLYDDRILFQRYVEEKYNERMQDYKVATGDETLNFRRVNIPLMPENGLKRDWLDFCATETRTSFYHLGALTSTNAARQKVIPRNLRAFREYMKTLCGGDIDVFHERYSRELKSWFYLEASVERFLDRSYTLPRGHALTEAYDAFKTSRPIADRIYLSADAEYRSRVRADGRYGGDIAVVNQLNGTSYGSFSDVYLPDTIPAGPMGETWARYVRHVLHPQFIDIDPTAQGAYVQFLTAKYGRIANLNKVYGTTVTGFSEVSIPIDRISSSPELIDISLYLQDTTLLRDDLIKLNTPELHWRALLRSRYTSLAELNSSHGRNYSSFGAVPMPQKTMDFEFVQTNSTQIRMDLLTRNYLMVIDYISVYGNGLNNTIIYCLLAIISALTVNPLAAYALSRFRLPSQYKILLFFIATIAFPGMVTMIPGYLLLKDLGLLNTFAALVLPGLASGYSIFLLKGFFDSLPKELYEAADMDGASEWFKFWRITMNLSQPILAVIALGAFTAAYGNFMYAFVLCQDSDMWTLMVWLYQLQYYAAQGVQFASLIVAAVPTLLVFVLAQRIIIRGIVVPVEK